MLHIVCRTVGQLATCSYILYEEGRDDCLVIDPGADASSIRRACGERRIAAILLTHGHFDHIGAAGELMEADTELIIHREDAPMLSDPVTNVSVMIGRDVTAPDATCLVKEGDVVDCAGIALQVLHTPGHTPGSVCYLTGKHLFTGDTMFDNGYGRTDLPGGDFTALVASLRRLMPYRQDHEIYPGHGS